MPCASLCVATDTDQKRLYIGGIHGRTAKTFNNLNYDISEAGVNTAISFQIKTGKIFVDGQRYLIKGFKKFSLIFTPLGVFTLTVNVKIDNAEEQLLSFTSDLSILELLGSTFILGTSQLGGNLVLAPYTVGIDGYGRSIEITIEQNGIDQQVDIIGMGIEYAPAGPQQEVL